MHRSRIFSKLYPYEKALPLCLSLSRFRPWILNHIVIQSLRITQDCCPWQCKISAILTFHCSERLAFSFRLAECIIYPVSISTAYIKLKSPIDSILRCMCLSVSLQNKRLRNVFYVGVEFTMFCQFPQCGYILAHTFNCSLVTFMESK